MNFILTLSWLRSLCCRNQSFDLLCKSIDWFLHDRDLNHERFKGKFKKPFNMWILYFKSVNQKLVRWKFTTFNFTNSFRYLVNILTYQFSFRDFHVDLGIFFTNFHGLLEGKIWNSIFLEQTCTFLYKSDNLAIIDLVRLQIFSKTNISQ